MRLLGAFVLGLSMMGCASKPAGDFVANVESTREVANSSEDPSVFVEKSTWTNHRGENMDSIDSEGIIMDALQKAYRKCNRKYNHCVLMHVELSGVDRGDGYNDRDTSYVVVMKGVDAYVSNANLKKFFGEDSVNGSEQLGQLILLAAQYGALSDALKNCYTAGYTLCAIGGYNMVEANNYREGKYWTSAEANVLGIPFARSKKMSTKPDSTFELKHGIPVPTYKFPSNSLFVEKANPSKRIPANKE